MRARVDSRYWGIRDTNAKDPGADEVTKYSGGYQVRVKILNYDNGREIINYLRTEEELDMTVYFTRTYSSWEPGTNENSNGLVRQFVPRGIAIASRLQRTRIDDGAAKSPFEIKLIWRAPHEVC